MQDVSFRKATATDGAFLREMLFESLYVPAGHEPFSRAILEHSDVAKYVEGWGREGDFGLLAEHHATSVGAAWVRLLQGEARGYGYVDDETPELSVALLPEYRGKGVGAALMERLLEEAALRYEAVSLSVSKGNPARKLYERLGFEQVGEDDASAVMLKPLRKRP